MARRVARGPLSRRVGLALFATGAVCIAVTAGVFYGLWSDQTVSLRTTELGRQTGVVAAGVAVSDVLPGSVVDTDQARARLLKVEAGLIGARIAVTDTSGTVLYSTAGSSSAASYDIGALSVPESDVSARSGIVDVPQTGRVVVVAVPVSFDDNGQPLRFLVGARPLSDLGSVDRWALTASGAAVVVGLLAAWLLGVLLTRRITSPLVRLTEGARGVAAGEWGRQVPVEGDDEVSDMARAFNDMSSRVADAYLAQKEFVGDVSHELRTPVTSIKGFADAISDGTVSGEAGVHHAAEIISSEATRLSELTGALLALADLDSGAVEVAVAPIDVTPLGQALAQRFAMVAYDAGVTLGIDLRGTPLADSERLLQALSALVDNAVKHARGRVLVTGASRGSSWIAEVDDDGPGVPPRDRERVFGRFTRLDAARAGGGSGLGLAICRRLVELMGGRVRAASSPDLGGARFTIELPDGPGPSLDASTGTQHATNPRAIAPADTGDAGQA
jgi:signal transduction histidine kinase